MKQQLHFTVQVFASLNSKFYALAMLEGLWAPLTVQTAGGFSRIFGLAIVACKAQSPP